MNKLFNDAISYSYMITVRRESRVRVLNRIALGLYAALLIALIQLVF